MKKITLFTLALVCVFLASSSIVDAKIKTTNNIKKPTSLNSNIFNDSTLKLSWKGNSKAKYYKVQLRKSNGKIIKKWKKVKKESVSIDDYIKADKKYKFKVRACKKQNCSKWSIYKKFNTNSGELDNDNESNDDNDDLDDALLDADGDGYNENEDCNDFDPLIHSNQTYYTDNDGDGLGNPDSYTSVCSNYAPSGYVSNSNDSDDDDYFNGSNPTCSSNIYNCSDFSTQQEAQNYYDYCVNLGYGDIHDLDRDGNGLACESLS